MTKVVLLIGVVLLLGLIEIVFIQYVWRELVIEVCHANVEELSFWKACLLDVVIYFLRRPTTSFKKKD